MPFVTPLRPDDPRRVGRYRLAGRIADDLADPGAGGTFLSRLPDGSPVAVTQAGKASAPDAASRDRFSAEARAARRVAPFCAARILDAGFDEDQPFLVSEFIEGPSLLETVRAEGPLAAPVLVALAIGTATGLASIHQAGLVHGDFGPAHVVLGAEGPRVVHFSITPPYGAATPAADLLSWARMMLFAATGRPADGPPGLASLPEPVRNVVSACLAPDPASRPQARKLVAALLGNGEPAAGLLAEGTRRARAAGRGVIRPAARPHPDEDAPRVRYQRAAWVAALAGCLAVIAVAATLIARHQSGHPGASARPAADSSSAPRPTAPATPIPAPTIPPALSGTWSGTVRQTDPDLQVTVTVQLPAGATAGTVAYPQLACSGRLQLVSAAIGSFTLDQAITNGQQNCEDGVITLTPQSPTQLGFTFRRSGAPSPAGLLTRQSA